jgi:hypothetical protein
MEDKGRVNRSTRTKQDVVGVCDGKSYSSAKAQFSGVFSGVGERMTTRCNHRGEEILFSTLRLVRLLF